MTIIRILCLVFVAAYAAFNAAQTVWDIFGFMTVVSNAGLFFMAGVLFGEGRRNA